MSWADPDRDLLWFVDENIFVQNVGDLRGGVGVGVRVAALDVDPFKRVVHSRAAKRDVPDAVVVHVGPDNADGEPQPARVDILHKHVLRAVRVNAAPAAGYDCEAIVLIPHGAVVNVDVASLEGREEEETW